MLFVLFQQGVHQKRLEWNGQQVHDRVHYLEALIDSMSQVSGIDSALLIFSHDVWDPKINDLGRDYSIQ